MIGTFGNIVFESSSEKVRTFDGFTRTGKARFSEHEVVDGKARLQHLGTSLDEIAFNIRLDMALGVNPETEINALRDIRNAGEEQRLIIGGKPLGKFVLEEVTENWRRLDGKGVLLVAEVALKLKEYAGGTDARRTGTG